MKVVIDDLWLCVDCTMIAVNDDATGIESDERIKECYAGIAKLGLHLVVTDGEEEFSTRECDACHNAGHGSRQEFAVLGEETTPETSEEHPS